MKYWLRFIIFVCSIWGILSLTSLGWRWFAHQQKIKLKALKVEVSSARNLLLQQYVLLSDLNRIQASQNSQIVEVDRQRSQLQEKTQQHLQKEVAVSSQSLALTSTRTSEKVSQLINKHNELRMERTQEIMTASNFDLKTEEELLFVYATLLRGWE